MATFWLSCFWVSGWLRLQPLSLPWFLLYFNTDSLAFLPILVTYPVSLWKVTFIFKLLRVRFCCSQEGNLLNHASECKHPPTTPYIQINWTTTMYATWSRGKKKSDLTLPVFITFLHIRVRLLDPWCLISFSMTVILCDFHRFILLCVYYLHMRLGFLSD